MRKPAIFINGNYSIYEKDLLSRDSFYRVCQSREEALLVCRQYVQNFGMEMGHEHRFIHHIK